MTRTNCPYQTCEKRGSSECEDEQSCIRYWNYRLADLEEEKRRHIVEIESRIQQLLSQEEEIFEQANIEKRGMRK
ncbi:MAG TPA: hypothetical protein VGB37_12785 [Candidatus Lokiarchaeia archaeon]